MVDVPEDNDTIQRALQAMAEGFSFSMRSPILHSPNEFGLAYDDVTFPSLDGVPLEGWFIPAPGSDKIIVVNHPRWFSRSGLPSHLEPWRSVGAAFGNDFEVNLVPDFKVLHEAGYNVLAYDLRNFGHSGGANGGVSSSGNYECRDVVGSLNYVRGRSDLREMSIGLFSRCLGCNATLVAMARYPHAFEDVRCLVGCQPLSPRYLLERVMESRGIPPEMINDLDSLMKLKTSFAIDDLSPAPSAKSDRIPTLLYQVRDDSMTRPVDVQTIYDNIPIAAKQLFWIEGSTRRWDGYTYFQKDPSLMLDWFARYLK